jgi:branched-chain amino acid transport system substrate-binding protein
MQGMKKIRFSLFAFAAIAVLMTVVACGGDDPTPTPKPAASAAPAAAPAPAEMKLGFTVPMSGTYAQWGRLTSGMQCAIDELHDSGELGNVTIKLLPEDSKADQAEGVTGLRKLASLDGAPVIMTIFTGIGLAQKPVAEELGVVLVSSGIQNPKFAKGNDWVFRNALNTTWNADALVRYITEEANEDLTGETWAVFKEEGNDSIDLQIDRLKDLAKEKGFTVAVETYQKGDTKFDTPITKIKKMNPKIVQTMALGQELGLIFNAIAQQGLKPDYRLSGGGAEGNVDLIRIAGANADGIIYSAPAYEAGADPRTQRFVDCYSKAQGGDTPDTYAASFYDGTLFIAEAIKSGADVSSAADIRDHLAKVKSVHGVSGRWDYTSDGDAWAPVSIGQVQDGKFVKIVSQIEPY